MNVGRQPILDRGLLLCVDTRELYAAMNSVGRQPILDRGLLLVLDAPHDRLDAARVGRQPILDRGLLRRHNVAAQPNFQRLSEDNQSSIGDYYGKSGVKG